MNSPLVSVIIPTFNRANILSETLNSVMGQDYSNWECIVVDDGSEDTTTSLLHDYQNRDNRFRFYQRPDDKSKGANACRNHGLLKSKGEYIQWLDSDDTISPDKLRIQVSELVKNNADLAFCKWGKSFSNRESFIYENLKIYNSYTRPEKFFEDLSASVGYYPYHGYLMSRNLVEKAGNFLEHLNINQDGEFMARVLINAKKLIFTEVCCALYKMDSPDNTSRIRKDRLQQLIFSWEIIELNLKIRFGRDDFKFIQNAKLNIYNQSKGYKRIIKNNRRFFNEQIQQDPNFIRIWFFRKLNSTERGKTIWNYLRDIRKRLDE